MVNMEEYSTNNHKNYCMGALRDLHAECERNVSDVEKRYSIDWWQFAFVIKVSTLDCVYTVDHDIHVLIRGLCLNNFGFGINVAPTNWKINVWDARVCNNCQWCREMYWIRLMTICICNLTQHSRLWYINKRIVFE